MSVERFRAADGTQLAVHVLGEGSPVVCLPGGPGRASAYLEDLAGLSETHTLLRLDMRGTGHSELPDDRASLTFPALADDVEALRVERGLETMDVLAHSAGCFVALVYAARHPDRIGRLVLVTPSGHGFGDPSSDVAAIRASRSDEDWYAEAAAVEAEVAMMPEHRRQRPHRELRVFGYGTWDDRAQAHAASTDSQMSLRAMAGFGPGDLDSEELRAALGVMAAPVLIVVGERDGVTGVKAGYDVAGTLPDATVVELAGAGHYPWVDAAAAFHAAVADFLR